MSAAEVAVARALEHWPAELLQAAPAACLKTLTVDERHVGAAALAPEILLRVGRAGPAVALLSEVVRREPDDEAARLLLACAQRTAGDIRAAEGSAAPGRRLSRRGGDAAAEHALALIALDVRTRRRSPR